MMDRCKLSISENAFIDSGISMEELIKFLTCENYILACRDNKLYYYNSQDPFLNSLIFEEYRSGMYCYRDNLGQKYLFNKILHNYSSQELTTFHKSVYPYATVNIFSNQNLAKINTNELFFKEVTSSHPVCIIHEDDKKIKFFLPQNKVISESKNLFEV